MMNDNVKYLSLRSKVQDILDLLYSCGHNAFPVVDSEAVLQQDGTFSYGRLRGIINRHEIITMIKNRNFLEINRFGLAESYALLRKGYPRFNKLEDLEVDEEDLNMTIDFSNAINSAPYTAISTMSMPAVYNLFRNMGMRHLIVVNLDNEVIGVITRKDIAALEPQMNPFPGSKITLKKKTLVIKRARTVEKKRDFVRKRKVTLTSGRAYQRMMEETDDQHYSERRRLARDAARRQRRRSETT